MSGVRPEAGHDRSTPHSAVQCPTTAAAAVAAVIGMCITIKMVEGRIAWQLDQNNFSLTLYRTSQFMLSLLLAFRLVSSNYTSLCPAAITLPWAL